VRKPLLAAAMASLLAMTAWAEESETGYWTYLRTRAGEIADSDLWGRVTAQLPKGVLGIKFEIAHMQADSKYDDKGDEGPIVEPIELDDPFGGEGRFMSLDLNAEGHGYGYTFQLSYGLNDPADVYIEFPFQQEFLYLHPEFEPGTCAELGIRTLDDLYELLEMLGRPRMKEKYESDGLELGDIHAGVSWNYYRSRYLSLAATGRAFFPTGRLADPNQALAYGLGPQLDVGMGSYAIGATHGLDFRPPWPLRLLTTSFELSWAYYFRGRRESPRFLKPQVDIEKTFGADPEIMAYFPDLSDMPDHYYLTYGHQIDYSVALGLDFTYFAVAVGYSYAWAQEPELDTSCETFEQMVELFGMFAEQESKKLTLHAGSDLFRLGVPVAWEFVYEYPIGGKNEIKFEDYYQLTTQLFFPF